MRWKSAHYRRPQVPDVFSSGWTVQLLRMLWRRTDQAFCGVLSTLYAGASLVAVHFALRSRGVLHSWFPAYDMNFARYSPGMVLFSELIREGYQHGITRIDLGKGDAQYQRELMTGATLVGEGCVALNPLAHVVHDMWPRTKDWIKKSPLKKPLGWVGRTTRRARGRLAFR